MNLNEIDLRLKLPIDSYLKNLESFKFIDKVMTTYNKNHTENIINLRDNKFYDKYTYIYKLLSVLTLKREYDDEELMFLSNIAYKQKGSVESIKTILNLVKCEFDELTIDDGLSFKLRIKLEDVREIYLATKYLEMLSQDLLFYNSYDVYIESMSVGYKLTGNVNKRYAVYTTYDLLSEPYIVSDEYEDTKVERDWQDITDHIDVDDIKGKVTEKISNTATGLVRKTTTTYEVSEDNKKYREIIVKSDQMYKPVDIMSIDTYNW